MGTVVLISVDGLEATSLRDNAVRLPSLRSLAAQGVAAAGLRPAFPSVTWPCHTTLVTGVPPAHHGILGNEVFDRATGQLLRHEGDRCEAPVRAETLWDAAAAAGLSTAALCWPKTRAVRTIRDNVPEFLDQSLFEEWASRPLWAEARALGLPVERYADWSVSRPLAPLQDWLTLELTRHVVRRRPPDLLLTHFLMVDSFQHEFGPGSPEARWALEHVDGLVGTLLAELDRRRAARFHRRDRGGRPRFRAGRAPRAAERRAPRRGLASGGRPWGHLARRRPRRRQRRLGARVRRERARGARPVRVKCWRPPRVSPTCSGGRLSRTLGCLIPRAIQRRAT